MWKTIASPQAVDLVSLRVRESCFEMNSRQTIARHPSGTAITDRLTWWATLLAAWCMVARPIDLPRFWWDLACGRAVVAGTFFPSSSLLLLDQAADANWLGGVPGYLLWAAGGVTAVAAIPLIATTCLCWSAWRIAPALFRSPVVLASVPLLFWTIRSGLVPVSTFFDSLGLFATWWCLQREHRGPATWLILSGVFVIWANFGPNLWWGLLLIAVQGRPVVVRPWQLLAVVLGGCITPRGLWTWWDAGCQFLVNLSVTSAESWPAVIVLILVWLIWAVMSLTQGLGIERMGLLVIPLMAAIINPANVPLCGLWIWLDMLQCFRNHPGLPDRFGFLSRWGADMKACWCAAASVVMLLPALLLDSWGMGIGQEHRPGFGLSHRLDFRLLDLSHLPHKGSPWIAWSSAEAACGMLAWQGSAVQVLDHPRRAWLGGRWQQHADFIADLKGAHRGAYRRADGSWGGWKPQADRWQVDILAISARESELHRALVDTPWQPLDLDAPVVPYLSAEDIRLDPVVAEGLQQREFVEYGPWQPAINVYFGHGWRFDFGERIGWGTDPAAAIDQTELFRSFGLPLAGLRALLPVRRLSGSPALQRQLQLCHTDLAEQERRACGTIPQFRQQLLLHLGVAGVVPQLAGDRAALSNSGWLRHYDQGNLGQAADELRVQSPEGQYGAALLWLEAGDVERARTELTSLQNAFPSTPIGWVSRDWLERLPALNTVSQKP